VTPTAAPPDRVLLIGMMGAGKTTVGRALSQLIGWPYADNDELLQRAVGKDTRRVQQEDGERALRRAESAALDVALCEGGPLVAGVAGGVVLDPLDVQRLRAGGFVVWLRAELSTLARRVAGSDRPWLGDDPLPALRALYAGRADLYASVASLIVDVDALPPDQVALRIAASLSHSLSHSHSLP
jgi:shikimate kinase